MWPQLRQIARRLGVAGEVPSWPARPSPHATLVDARQPDLFAWLQHASASELRKILRAERDFFDARASEFAALQRTIHEELLSSVLPDEETPPEQLGQHFYSVRSVPNQEFPVYVRQLSTPSAKTSTTTTSTTATDAVKPSAPTVNSESPAEVLLDMNKLGEGAAFVGLGLLKISPDESKLAYTLDRFGREQYELFLKQVPPGRPQEHQLLSEVIPASVGGFDWSADGRYLFYTRCDRLGRPYCVYRHELGTDPACDPMLYEESDPTFALEIALTRDHRFVIITASSVTSSEIRFLPADQPLSPLCFLIARRPGVRYYVDTFREFFAVFIKSDQDRSFSFKCMEIPAGPTAPPPPLRDLLPPPTDGAIIEDCEVFRDALVTFERYQGFPRVRVHHFRPELGRFESQTVTCPALAQPLSSIHPGVNQYNTRSLRLFVSSVLLEPTTIEVSFDHPHAIASVLPGPAAAAASTWKFPYENFTADRVMVPNRHDHTPIPVSVFHRADYQFDHSAPTLLLAYGAYGSPLNPEFNPTLLSLLQRGWVVAYAHVRGGGEFGPPWHQAGKLLQKRHTFEDFLSCAEALVDRGYTQPQLLAAMGSSAGGLTVAASINQQPDLFRAAVLTVPFVDVLSPMYQPELPLTVAEYAEWGNPMTSPEIHQYIASYDPYLTIPQQPAWFPRLLVTASTLDQRVPFWIPLKYVTKLRAQLPAELRRQIILKIDESTGHGGEGGRYAGWEDQSLYVAFLLHALADSPPAVRPKI